MYQGDEDLPPLKTVLMQLYNHTRTTYKNMKEGLITAIRNARANTTDNRMTITRKQKWEEKQLYGRFKRLINNISLKKT